MKLRATYLLLLALLLLDTSILNAQDTTSFENPTNAEVDSSENKKKGVTLFPGSYGDKRWKFLIGLDARRSFYRDAPVKINGLKIGVEFKGVHRWGHGFYWLNKGVSFKNSNLNKSDAHIDKEIHFTLGYVSFFYERLFLKTRWWEITSPSHVAAGKITGTYKDTANIYKPLLERPFSALTKAAQVRFFPFTWFSIKFLSGFRITFNTDQEVKDAFNRPFYGFGFSLHLMELYKAIFKKEPDLKLNNENNSST